MNLRSSPRGYLSVNLLDRRVVGMTLVRLLGGVAGALSSLTIPTLFTATPTPIAALIPLVVTVPLGLTLNERLAVLVRPAGLGRWRRLRVLVSLVADVVVLVTTGLVIAIARGPVDVVWATCALTGFTYAFAYVLPSTAWLAAAVGATALLFSVGGRLLVELVPAWVAATLLAIGIASLAFSNPRVLAR